MYWLTKCPLILLSACLAMVDPLKAEESLRAVTISAIGSGTRKPEATRPIVAAWERELMGETGPVQRKPLPPMSPEVRALMGLDDPPAEQVAPQ